MNIYPLYHCVSFYPSLLTFHLKIAYRKVRNLQIGVKQLVGKVSINLLHLTAKPAASTFLLLQLPYCVNMLLTSRCKAAILELVIDWLQIHRAKQVVNKSRQMLY